MATIEKRLQDLEAKAGGEGDATIIIEVIYGTDQGRPSPELVAEAERRARGAGQLIIIVSRGRGGDGEWRIEGGSDENTQQG
jgi:nucleotide-binding universal stress UspA family protein